MPQYDDDLNHGLIKNIKGIRYRHVKLFTEKIFFFFKKWKKINNINKLNIVFERQK